MNDKFNQLREIITKLRSEDGCPWDREQTQESLKPCLIEEVYEVVEAIESGDKEQLKEELGDLFIQLLSHIQLASEKGLFEVDDVLESACDKLVRRHPHVFGSIKIDSSAEVLVNWEKIKREEKKAKLNN